jgi:hypothetical protein
MKATVHKGPKGGTEYRLWSSADTYRVVSKYKALPHLSDDDKAKAAAMEANRKATEKAKSDDDHAWRTMMRGGR